MPTIALPTHYVIEPNNRPTKSEKYPYLVRIIYRPGLEQWRYVNAEYRSYYGETIEDLMQQTMSIPTVDEVTCGGRFGCD